MSNIAIITARSGSKRIPKKNIRSFFGKPIVAYSIEAALKSNIFDEVMVSTDSQEIADISIKYGATVPFLRSSKNSDDFATTAEVVEEVLLEYKKIGKEYEYFCCLYPTAPFITPEKLAEALLILEQSGADSVFSVTPFSHPFQRSFKMEHDNTIKMFFPEYEKIRSQDLETGYCDCGLFYFLNTKNFLIKKKIFSDKTRAIVVPESECQDIDNEEDWKIAELKYKLKYRIY